MAASLDRTFVSAAVSNVLTLRGQGLIGGAGASLSLDAQGVISPPGFVAKASLSIVGATFASDGRSVQFVVPEMVTSGMLTVTASDGTSATLSLRIESQYLQAEEYEGEGADLSLLQPGELDVILRRASSLADAFMHDSLRIEQRVEQHRYRASSDSPPRIRPYRRRMRRIPLVSVDQLIFISSRDQVTAFNPVDTYIDNSLGYIEVLAYAVGNYALLGALQSIGYSANVFEIVYTSGYTSNAYPAEVRNATAIIASSLLDRRRIRSLGLAGLTSLEDLKVDTSATIGVPMAAKQLLLPYVSKS